MKRWGGEHFAWRIVFQSENVVDTRKTCYGIYNGKKEQRKNRKRGQAEKMKYEHITEGRFIDRPNRFIAHVEINGQVETVHVKNTGRCREFLVPGTLKLVFTK